MFQVGQKVLYGIHGVCVVTDFTERTVDRKKVCYLVLEPADQPGSQFLIPTHNPAAMGKLKAILSSEELQQLLHSDAARGDVWIQDENQRKQRYRELIGCGDRGALLSMIRALYRHKDAQAAAGRKFHQCDENFLRDAEKLMVSELCLSMGLPSDQAREYLRSQLRE